MSKIFPGAGQNSAPNYVPQTEMRVPFSLDPRPSAALGAVVGRPQIGVPGQSLAPIINWQTVWGLNSHFVQNPQGFKKVK